MRRLFLCLFAALAAISFGVTEAASAPVTVTYSETLPEEIRDQIEDRLPDEVDAESALQARRQARRARTLASNILNAYGYFNPTLEIRVDTQETGRIRPQPILNIDPGPQFTLDRVIVRYVGDPPREDSQRSVETDVTLRPGDPAIAADVIDVSRQITTILRERGYAFAEALDRETIGDKEAQTISVRYTISSGPRVRIGETLIPDDLRTRDRYLMNINPLESGQLYDPNELALYNSRLSETRIFDRAIAKVSEEDGEETADGDQIRDVILDLTERDRYTLTLGAGYDTSEGFGVEAELLRRNLTGYGDLLIGEATVSQRELGLGVIWRRPNVFGYGRGLNIFASVSDENTDAFDQQTARLGVGLEVVEGPDFQYGLGLEGRYISQVENDVRRDFQVISANGSFAIDKSDSILDPRRGWRAEGRIKPTYSFSPDGPDVPYMRSVAQARAYLPLDGNARYVLAGRLRAGTLVGASAQDVPGEDRFYAGGGGSVRGYGFQAIGPFDLNDDPEGGRSLLEASIEGRARVRGNIGAVAFIDGGNVSDEIYPAFDNLRFGAGVGVRYQTPAGPIRLDVATPLNPSDRDEAVQVYISIGQAF